ncbi:MAG: ATP-bind-3 domain-containing protein [Thermocaproicibacter melissae]|jgi:tRNA 2-thiocytidine biosynthesis protein TtcA|uniref:tRNA lysidine(34) synthetase n=1 Tax=Thermocaproicibacter melissae TaxID=2966552 RepID=UPI0024B083CA|nr:ATP-binding protein [Thermocaproicibacter melissae]WBY64981.1 ATP-binding protein [Thermocaproicibacter melissae]
MEPFEQAERSITKKYRRQIWLPFLSAVKQYELIQQGDRIAVCISGGKDSMLLAKCMQHLQKYSDFPFEVEYLVMDPGYNAQNRRQIIQNAEALHLPIHIFDTRIFEITEATGRNPCYLCAKMRRGCLYKHARELGCNKIALGHHFDDVIETTLMSMLYGAEIRTMMPKLHSLHYPGMELIRPLYLVREADIIAWKNYNNLTFLQCACRFTESCAAGQSDSKRQEMKRLIAQLRKGNPNIDKNIFHSMENVNLETVIGYRRGSERHNFLENYNK